MMNIVRSQSAERCSVIPKKTYRDNSLKYPVWEVSLAPGFAWGCYFLAAEANEQDAIDAVIDYCEEHAPGLLLDDEYIDELRQDALKDGHEEDTYLNDMGTCGGNAGRYLHTPYGLNIVRVL